MIKEIWLNYQKETGYCFDTVIRLSIEGDPDYVEWLENKLEK